MLGLGVGWRWWVVDVDDVVVVGLLCVCVSRDVFALRRISLSGVEEGEGWMLQGRLRWRCERA